MFTRLSGLDLWFRATSLCLRAERGTFANAISSLLLGLSLVTAGSAHAQQAVFDSKEALAISQGVIGKTLTNHNFTDRSGGTFRLHQLRDKPLIISMIYTSCYHSCSVITRHLANIIEVAREATGEDSFNVITVGFDIKNDSPDRMHAYARQQGVANENNWYFLSADAGTMAQLVKELGFTYFTSPKGFDHLAQFTILDRESKVYRQVYGETLNPPAIVEPIKELVFNLRASPISVSEWVNNIRLFCTIYDPTTGRYQFDYSIFVGVLVGVLSLSSIGYFIVWTWREHKQPTNHI